MNRAMQAARLVLAAVLVWLGAEMALAARSVRALADRSTAAVAEAETRLAHTSQNLNGVVIQLGLAADQWAQASREQRDYWNRTAAETEATMASLRRSADTLHASVLPQLVRSLEANDRRMDLLSAEAVFGLRQTVDGLAPVIADLGRASEAAAIHLSDPAISASLRNVEAASAELAAAGRHIETTTSDLRDAVHRMTRPARWWKRMGLAALDVAFKARVLFGRR